ncbi:MAG: luciferase family protein [Bacteroidota bacterium]
MKNKSFFYLVVRYLGFLKYVPLLPHVFDSILRLCTLLWKPYLLDWFDDIEQEVLGWPGTHTTNHKYGGLQFNVSDFELGHLHSNGLLDVRYSRKIKEKLLEQGRIKPHHVFAQSGWISFSIITCSDKAYAIELLALSYKQQCKI